MQLAYFNVSVSVDGDGDGDYRQSFVSIATIASRHASPAP
jgi:hypothetical protein